MRDVGNAGEHFFSGWCSSAGITANKSLTDNHGWDVLIETENELDPTDPLTMHEPIVECKVQIKSTDKNKKSVPVTLSNLKKMATTPLPAFYTLLEFDDNDMPSNMYILHVNNELAKKILTRIRQLTAADKKTKLNERTMTLNFTDDMQVLPPFGNNLKRIILDTVGTSPSTYVREKQLFLDQVGFEKGNHEFRFNIEGNEQLEQLISMTLGTGGSVNVKDVLTMVTRFGISEELPEFRSDSAVIEILKVRPDSQGIAEFRFPSTGLALTFNVEVYKNGLNSWVPPEMRRVRISSELLDIQIGVNSSFINLIIRLDSSAMVDLADAAKTFKLYNALRTPKKISLTVKIDDIIIPLKLDHKEPAPEYYSHLSIIETLQSLKHSFEFYDKLDVQLPEIWKKATHIHLISTLINNEADQMQLRFPLAGGPGSLSEAHLINAAELTINKITFMIVYAVIGEAIMDENEIYTIKPTTIKILYKTFIHKDEAQNIITRELMSELVNNYETCEVCFNMIDAYVSAKELSNARISQQRAIEGQDS